jgi:hypothetical protein
MEFFVFLVIDIGGQDIEEVVEVKHTAALTDMHSWVQSGVFMCQPRFHYGRKFDTKSR